MTESHTAASIYDYRLVSSEGTEPTAATLLRLRAWDPNRGAARLDVLARGDELFGYFEGLSDEGRAHRVEVEAVGDGDPAYTARYERVESGIQRQCRELAEAIATQAQALADGTVIGPRHAAVARLARNVDTLRAWTPDDRSGA
jgi:hypothetical protein